MAGVINTTYSFIANDLITSTKLNNIADQSSFTTDAYDGTSITVTGAGKLKVAPLGITAAELASDAVTTPKILNGQVSAAKLSTDSVETLKIKDLNVTGGKIAAATITIDKMAVAALATTAQAQSETVSTLITADKVKQTPPAAKAYGSVTIASSARTLSGSYNVASTTRISSSYTQVTFTSAMSSAAYTVVTQSTDSGSTPSAIENNPMTYDKLTTGFKIFHAAEATDRAFDFVVFGTLA